MSSVPHKFGSSIWRTLRSHFGYPASSDIGLIARMLMELRDSTESVLGQPVVAAVTSYPFLTGLCEQDIHDALQYAGIMAIYDLKLLHQPHEVSAAYAGYGFGLCRHYTNRGDCRNEEWDLAPEEVITIEFTEQSLLLKNNGMTTAWGSFESADTHIIDYDAGLARLSDYPGGQEVY